MLSDRDSVFTWEHGRELTSMTAVGFLWQFTYDQNGMRTSRTNGNRVYNYVYNGDSLRQVTVDNHDLNFTYDASGRPLTLIYDGTAYWYDLNLQGDVVGILDSNGNTVVSYTYNAWGCILSITGSEKDSVGFYNPLRYRGYVWDPETGLYYLQSRYYNPGLGRFINADAFTSTGQGLLGNNMFAYCNNNPVGYKDDTGNIPFPVMLAISADGVQDFAGIIGTYAELRKLTAGKPEYQVHHIIDFRFASVRDLDVIYKNYYSAPAVIVSKTQHQLYTNYTRESYPYGKTNYSSLSGTEIKQFFVKMYKNLGGEIGDIITKEYDFK